MKLILAGPRRAHQQGHGQEERGKERLHECSPLDEGTEAVVMEISSFRSIVCDTMDGQRTGCADPAHGRCRAGEEARWRRGLPGRV